MEFKPVPEPPDDLEGLESIRAAVPRVPKPQTDCCQRLQRRVPSIADRDEGADWLTFLRALELADEYDRGYARTDDEPPRAALGERFRERVVLAEAVCSALDPEPASAGDVFERVRGSVPEWERRRVDDWESVWSDRVRRLLDWAVLFGVAERTPDGYRRQ